MRTTIHYEVNPERLFIYKLAQNSLAGFVFANVSGNALLALERKFVSLARTVINRPNSVRLKLTNYGQEIVPLRLSAELTLISHLE